MSLLEDYEARTQWKYVRPGGRFETHPELGNKVDAGGAFLPFPGSTVVFRLERQTEMYLTMVQAFLHSHLKGMLAQPLPETAFHMTLHDLVNPETPLQGVSLSEGIRTSAAAASEQVEAIWREHGRKTIGMVPDRVVNMMSKSLVLMLKPASEADYILLLQLYRQFDSIVSLPYPLTPHITLAYFRPGEIDGDLLASALDSLQVDASNPMPVSLPVAGLTAQCFEDMQRYVDVPTRICFMCDGGMNRSVMAASVLNQMARERGVDLRGEARSAFRNTDGQPIPEVVRETLTRHGVDTVDVPARARRLRDDECVTFSRFAAISEGAISCVAALNVPKARYEPISQYYYGIQDPQLEVSCETAYDQILRRTIRFLDDWARGTRP